MKDDPLQESTLMVLSFADQLPSSTTVSVVMSSCADNEDAAAESIVASRVNPYTYTFSAPSGQYDTKRYGT